MPPRIGFFGAGFIAEFHLQLLNLSPVPAERVGVYDPDRERASRFAAIAGCEAVDSEAALLERCDAVFICTWTSEHPRLVAAAAAAGVHVFCEKPLAVDLDGALEVERAVTASGIVHQAGLILRRSPAYLVARDLIQDPAAGRIHAVVFRDDQYLPVRGQYNSTWRIDRRLAGSGTLLEHSIHDVDLLRMVIGEIDHVAAVSANHHGHDGIEDVVTATFGFANGALGTLLSVWHDNLARPSLRRLEIFCSHRYVVVDGHDWFGPVHWTDTDGTDSSLANDELFARAERLVEPGTTLDPAGDFLRSVAANTAAFPDVHLAVDAHRVVDALYRSAAADGQRQHL